MLQRLFSSYYYNLTIYSPVSSNIFKQEAVTMTTSYNITKRRQSCSFVQWVFGDTWERMSDWVCAFLRLVPFVSFITHLYLIIKYLLDICERSISQAIQV